MRNFTLFSGSVCQNRRRSNFRNQFSVLVTAVFMLVSVNLNAQVFISQYAEANSGTVPKAIEIYNASGADIDLSVSNIQVYQGTNGAAPSVVAGATTSSGILEDGKVWVIGTSETTSYATTNGTDLSGVTTFSFAFNGDDALQLYVGGVLMDVFGTPGVDPGTSWTGGGVNTANQNIQTLSGVCTGSLSGWSDPSTRFEVVSTTPSTVPAGLAGFGNAPTGCTASGTPTVFANPGILNLFSYQEGNGPSNELSFDVSGTDLTANITVTAPANFQVSTTSGSGFASSVNLTQSGGTVSTTTIYVRMIAGLSNAGSPYSGNIDVTSTGATTVNVSLSGTVNPPPAPACSEIFISEYIEGSSNNKYLEIYNPTASPIDLAAGNYSLRIYTNGSSTPSNYPITGVIGAYSTMVFKNSSASIYGGAATTNSACNFNGDDAVSLAKNGVDVDIFGVIGVDPGSAWTSGSNSTVDMSWIRNANANVGVNSSPATFSALGTDWSTSATIDDISNLGTHTSDCFVPTTPLVSIAVSPLSGSEAATTAITITATADAAVTGAQTVTVSLSGTGLSNSDFSGVTFPAVITILNGQTTGTLNFSVADDASIEGSETAAFDISAVSAGLTIGTPFNASFTITDNDAPLSCSDIYISEYIEGSGSNKYIEIYNPTSSSIDLGAGSYSLRLYANGASSPSNDVALTGVIPAYGTIVYKNGSATVYTGTAIANSAVNFNGDDAVAIAKAGVNIDIFGVIGTDPGSSWSFGGNVTADMSLRRNADKNTGVNINPGTFAALGTDWTAGSGIDDVSGLGAHVSDCFVPAVPTVSLSINNGAITEGSASTITLTATATSAVSGNQTINLSLSGASNADFSGITFPASITILNGQTTGSASFTLVDDAIPEGIENAVFAISSTTAGVIAFAPISAALTISDNDIPQIIINEIMYNNSGADEEWIELYNAGPYSILFDNNWNLTNSNPAWNYSFSSPIGIAPGGYLTIQVGSSGSFPFSADVVFSSASNQLVNSTSTITLLQNSNVVDVVTYNSSSPWPAGANGSGASLALNLPSLDNSIGSNWGDCKVNGSPGAENPNCNSTIYYTYSSGSVGSDIWVTSPTGTVPILANFTSGTDLVIRAGHTVLWDASAIPANNVSLQYAGRIWRNSNLTGDMTYLSLYGNLSSNNGIIGNGNTFDAIGINIEGSASTISGTGVLNIGRIRKNASDNTTSTLNINANLNLRYPGAALYNNQPSTTFNVNLATGKTVNVLGDGLTPGDVAVDGTNGQGAGERAGVYTINGTLNVSGTIYALTNNANNSFIPGITVGSTGRINVETLDMRFDGLADVGFNTVFNSGGRITVNGLMLQREGTFNANGGLVLNNGASLLHGVGTPGLAPDPGGLVTGNVIVNINANFGYGKYNFWSSPVTGASILSITQAGTAYGAQNNTYEYNPVNSTGTDIEGLRDGWVAKTNSDIMANGRGYITNSSPSARFTGPANNGNINVALTGNGFTKFNLIGNPYPSSLDAGAFLAANGPSGTNQIVPAIYFWDDDGSVGAAYDAGDYIATNALGTSGSGGNGSGTFAGAIAAGQGFFLEASPAGTNVQFTNSMRNSSSAFFFEADQMSRVWLKVSNTENVKNETLLAFLDEATDGYDVQFDAKKFPGNEGLSLYTTINNDAFAIQAWENLNIERVIPVGLNASIPAAHTFSLSQIDNLDPTVLVYLEDRELGTMTNLRVSDYTFNVSEPIEGAGRFFLHFSTPAEITAQAESCSGNDGIIQFEASNAWNYTISNSSNMVLASGNAFNQPSVNNLTAGDYVITMTADGYTTTLVSTVAATTPVSVSINGTTNTEVNVAAQFAAVVSGSQEVSWDFGDGSEIVNGTVVNHVFENAGIYTVTAFVSNNNCSTQQSMEVRVDADVTGFNQIAEVHFGMFPNPASNRVTIITDEDAIIQISDLTGKVLQSVRSNNQKVNMIDIADLSNGVYMVSLIGENGRSSRRLVIAH